MASKIIILILLEVIFLVSGRPKQAHPNFAEDTPNSIGNFKQLFENLMEINKEMKEMKAQIRDLQGKQASADVGFFAQISGGEQVVDEGDIVIFDVAVTNYGGGYNAATGSFIAPIHGYYEFTINFEGKEATDSELSLEVNDVIACIADTNNNYDQSSCTALVELQAGDVVNVKPVLGSATIAEGLSGKQHGFVGYLVLSSTSLASTDVGFFAQISGGQQVVEEGAIVIFDVAITNYGDGYNSATGSFIAPIHGYYEFNIYFEGKEATDSELSLVVNDVIACISDSNNGYDQSGCAALVELQAGDVVNVKPVLGSATIAEGHSGKQHGFVGHLLHPL